MEGPNFQQALDHIQSDEPLQDKFLSGLSLLTKTNLAQFQANWSHIEPARQKQIMTKLVRLAEQQISLNFDPILIWILQTAETGLQTIALEGLWENEDPALVPLMMRLLQEGSSIPLRATAGQALGKYIYLGEIEQLDQAMARQVEEVLLNTIYKAGEDTEVVRRAIESLAYSGREGVSDIIAAAYDDDDEMMQMSAIFAMGRSCDRAWTSILLDALDRDEPAIRFEAARACGELVISDAVPKLINLIHQEDDSEVQQSAIWALGQIGTKAAQDFLNQLLQHPEENIQWAAEESLDELLLLKGNLDDVFDYHANLI